MLYFTFLLIVLANIARCDESKIAELDLKCLDSDTHKPKPEKENELYGECSKWKDLSCCNKNTTESIHLTDTTLYNFNYDHCFPLSKECKNRFMQELCMYECDPYLGKFMVGDTSMKFRKQRYYKVPLCKRDCQNWFDACKYDYTCRDNWNRGFRWEKNGTLSKNYCFEQDKCRTFKSVFGNAERFCSSIWDESFEVKDDENCFSFDFEGKNPNEKTARYYHNKN